jgi:hypothetical protein
VGKSSFDIETGRIKIREVKRTAKRKENVPLKRVVFRGSSDWEK